MKSLRVLVGLLVMAALSFSVAQATATHTVTVTVPSIVLLEADLLNLQSSGDEASHRLRWTTNVEGMSIHVSAPDLPDHVHLTAAVVSMDTTAGGGHPEAYDVILGACDCYQTLIDTVEFSAGNAEVAFTVVADHEDPTFNSEISILYLLSSVRDGGMMVEVVAPLLMSP